MSTIDEFTDIKRFRVLLPDEHPELCRPEKVEKVIFCSGQVYYDLAKARSDLKRDNVAIVRLEQIAPFPAAGVQEQLEKYKNARVVWCQEEHLNMGAWNFVEQRMNRVALHVTSSC